MVKKIAVEEHCLCPGFEEYWAPTVADLPTHKREAFLARLTDFGEMRLEAMERAGIELCVLSLAGPGVQSERDTKTACDKARSANDFLAREIAKRPQRYSGLAHLAMQDAAAAAGDVGMDIRDRLARVAYHIRRRFRSLPARAACARPFGRNAAVLAMAFR